MGGKTKSETHFAAALEPWYCTEGVHNSHEARSDPAKRQKYRCKHVSILAKHEWTSPPDNRCRAANTNWLLQATLNGITLDKCAPSAYWLLRVTTATTSCPRLLTLIRSSAAHFSFRRLPVVRVPSARRESFATKAKVREGRNTIDPSDPAMQHTVQPMAKGRTSFCWGYCFVATWRPGRACSERGGRAPRSCHVPQVADLLQRWTRPPLADKFP